MATTNEEFFDALVRHQIGLLRVSGGIRNKIFALLDKTENDIQGMITRRLENIQGGATPADLAKAKVLSAMIKRVRADAWKKVTAALIADMIEIAKSEPEFMANATRSVSHVQLDLALPTNATLKTLVEQKPFEGRVLKQWAGDLAAADLKRIDDQIKIGMVMGESNTDIARRVVGSARLRGTDGIMEITRTAAAGLVRTAVNHYSNQARQVFANANSDIFGREQYVATLDARTTPVCRANDGKTFKIGEGPMPPLHWNCRSTRVPVLDASALGDRPAVAATEAGLAREFSDGDHSSRDALPHGTKGAFDKFAAKRIRALTGTVPESVSYQEWLGRQSSAFQVDVLGATRAKLFRNGGLQLDRFINRKGDELTLHELARREAAAFKAAGLNPKDF